MLEGKVAIVTGAGGGIGREMALALAAAGAKVVVNDIGASLAGEGADQGPAERVAGAEALAEHALPALRPSFAPLDVSADVFSWDPI